MSESVRDVRMLQRAIEQRWPIEERFKSAAITRLMQVIADKNASTRAVNAAVKALVAMESQNQKDEHKLLDASTQPQHDRLSSIASELGIDPRLIVDGSAKANPSPEGVEENGSKE